MVEGFKYLSVILIFFPLSKSQKISFTFLLLIFIFPIVNAQQTTTYPGITPDSLFWGLDKAFDQITLLLTTGDVDKAKTMTNSLLSNLETNENIGIWYGSNLIFSRNSTPYENAVDVEINRKFHFY